VTLVRHNAHTAAANIKPASSCNPKKFFDDPRIAPAVGDPNNKPKLPMAKELPSRVPIVDGSGDNDTTTVGGNDSAVPIKIRRK
jgi:hypothetical protein